MYNLIEYSDNYSDNSGSLYQFKKNEQNNGNSAVTAADSSPFKDKSGLLEDSVGDGGNRVFKNVKIAVPLKY